MNLVLLPSDSFNEKTGKARITEQRQLLHCKKVLKSQIGDGLTLGKAGGDIYCGTITQINPEFIELQFGPPKKPPAAVQLKLILALPRPNMFKRILLDITSMGIKELHIIQTQRVEKSYWMSPQLEPGHLRERMQLGLEQAKDTIYPELFFHKNFNHFIKNFLPTLPPEPDKWIAHPGASNTLPTTLTKPSWLAIGPEGGFIDKELNSFEQHGFQAAHMGERVLRVETAVIAALGKLLL